MKRHFFFTLILILLTFSCFAQKHTITGTITNASTGESLIGVNILFKHGVGVVTNFEGKYAFEIESGEYNITVSYVGYNKLTKKTTINSSITKDFKLNQTILDEVRIVADVAIARKTPIAFTNIEHKQIQENIASQDIPMILNSTPGVYATQKGGGDGDAQITIRGFSSRNVGVLLDGVPVNDMETGKVYWSNWFGLDIATRSIQVQRGLGASKLALPSVGGTINIITKGYDNKKEGALKQEVGSDGYLRTTLGYNTGRLKNDWSISVAGSYKRGNGWVDQTWTEGFFYYLKIDKKIKNHLLSFSVFGAPQSHGQRSYKLPVAVYDTKYANEIGITDDDIDLLQDSYSGPINMGLNYNQHWAYLAQTKNNPNAESKKINERINTYHKPHFTLKDSWTVNDKLFVSNILYMSIGRGGGIRAKRSMGLDEHGRMDFQDAYDENLNSQINPLYEDNLHPSGNYMRILKNDHNWYGLITTLNYKANSLINISGGVDLRSYKGKHYEEIYDMLGGDYVATNRYNPGDIDWAEPNPLKDYKLGVGDIDNYHNDGLVKWAGLFALIELDFGKVNTFINLTGTTSGYNRIDYFYGKKGGSVATKETGWKYLPGYTAKFGANYLLSENFNVFANVGYLSKAPRFNNVYDYSNLLWSTLDNEEIYAAELGISFKSRKFSSNINTYYTLWNNKPADKATKISDPNDESIVYSANIRGMNAIHKGIEFDFVYNITPKIKFQGIVSIGDWKWASEDTVYVYNDANILVMKKYFNAKGVHVGNSAQTQFSAELRYEPIKHLYFKGSLTYFDRYFAEFDPFTLDDDTPDDSWQIPEYILFDVHAGYRFKLFDQKLQLRGSVLNMLGAKYVATAQNNDQYNGQPWNTNDARSASVFMGIGRRYNISLQWYF